MACPGHGVSHRDPVSLSAGLSLPWGGQIFWASFPQAGEILNLLPK